MSAGAQNTTQFAKYLKQNLAPDYDACVASTQESLRYRDRHSWTREDYPQDSYAEVQEDGTSKSSGYTADLSFTPENGTVSLSKTFWDIEFFFQAALHCDC